MAQSETTITNSGINGQNSPRRSGGGEPDVAESLLRRMDESVKQSTGVSLFHILTIGSIGASIALYLSGKKSLGIFVGLWPPTFEALKAAAERGQKDRN